LNPLAGYDVRLHFVEWAHTAASQRNFNVSINSEQVLTNFDIFATAGAAATAITEQFYTTADENGVIEIETALGTTTVADLNPTINAIEIIATTSSNPVGAAPGSTTDLAINSGGPAVNNFVADEDYNGGDVATTTNTVSLNGNSAPEAVYEDQRYVPFTYVLTGLIADAPYTVKMHFAETYWTAAGQRVFSVALNGKYVVNDLDVLKTAGGQNIAYDPQFTANADKYGQIIAQFIYGGADQPFINAIEVVQSGSPTCTTVPSAPTGLTATASSSSAISLSWAAVTPPANCTIISYSVYRSTTSGFTPSSSNLVASGVTGTTYSNTGLVASTTYYYVVEALDGDGTSAASAQASATTQSGGVSCTTVPAAPTGLTATASSSSAIALSWAAVSPPANCTITSYSVYSSTTNGFTPSSSNLIASVTGTTYTNTGLTASTTYYYKVEALDTDGTSAASAQASATTQASGSGTSIVSINAGGPAESNSGGGDNSFVADEDFSTGGTTYSVTNTITIPASVATVAAPAAVYQSARQGTVTYTIPGLSAGTSYTVRLHFAELYFSAAGDRVFNVAINGTTVLTNFDIYATAKANYTAVVEQFTATANSSGDIVIAFTNGTVNQPMFNGIEVLGSSTSCTTVPSAPTGLTATASSSSAIGLSWTAVTPPANCTISSYSVYGSTTSGFTPSSSNLIASGVTGTTYTNTGLAASTTYYYKIEALDSDGSSAPSAQASAETQAASCTTVPSAPTGLTATASSSSAIGLSWTVVTPPANCTISSYSVYGSTTSGFTPSSSNLIAGGVTGTTYTNTGLAASTTYYYKVEAVDADGSSAASTQASATTQAAGGSSEVVAIACGGPAESNSGGGDDSFVADEDFSGGGDNSPVTATINLTQPGANAAPMGVYQHGRAGVTTYTIPGLTAGSTYTVLLHFAETYFTAAGDREFNVAINGTTVLTNLDIYGTVGKDAALLETFNTTANGSGQIVIAFTLGAANQPVVMGIEVRTN